MSLMACEQIEGSCHIGWQLKFTGPFVMVNDPTRGSCLPRCMEQRSGSAWRIAAQTYHNAVLPS